MYIETLSIRNLRCFGRAGLRFQHPDLPTGSEDGLNNVNLLLGDNGAGKTTVLRAAALAILAPVLHGGGFVPYSLVRRTSRAAAKQAEVRARVRLHSQDMPDRRRRPPPPQRLRTVVNRVYDSEILETPEQAGELWANLHNESSPAFLLVGYSATRRVESSATFDSSVRSRSRRLRYHRVAGLFEQEVTLTPLAAWLPELKSSNPGRYKQVHNLLNRLLPADIRFTGEREGNEYLFRRARSLVPFGALSDGYQAYTGWIADLLYHVCMGCPSGTKLVKNRGIVLVDEIDLHLHPDWQRIVVPTLARELPNLQFILTTHSPIVTGTLEARNIQVMRLSTTGTSMVRQYREEVRGKNADQVLLSPYFDLESTRAPEMVDRLHDLSLQAWDGDPEAAVAFLKELNLGMGGADASPEPAGSPEKLALHQEVAEA